MRMALLIGAPLPCDRIPPHVGLGRMIASWIAPLPASGAIVAEAEVGGRGYAAVHRFARELGEDCATIPGIDLDHGFRFHALFYPKRGIALAANPHQSHTMLIIRTSRDQSGFSLEPIPAEAGVIHLMMPAIEFPYYLHAIGMLLLEGFGEG
jgi:hypothetical protein